MENSVDTYLTKFEGLASAFEVTTKEMEENVKTKVQEIKDKNFLVPSSDLINIETLANDFQIMRQSLISNIQSTQALLNQFSNEITMDGVDVKPQLLSSYAELNESCNSGIKLLVEIYKNIADTHLKIKKLQETENPEKSGSGQVTNNLVITDTNSLLKKILEKNN